jgi:ATP-dependent helicase/nuclease subunit A
LFPAKRLRCFLIFIQNASVLEADQSALIAALEREFEQDAGRRSLGERLN